MPLPDLPMAVLFIIFLSLFILIGIYPAWKRSLAKFRRLLEAQIQSGEPVGELFDSTLTEQPEVHPENLQLDDFERLVLWQLSQNSSKTLSRKQLNNALHLEPAILKQTLESLAQKNLIRIAITSLLGIRFYLSEAGHAYAVKQGYIPQVLEKNGQSITT